MSADRAPTRTLRTRPTEGATDVPLTELRQYTAHTAQTATPGQLVVMLYDGFLRFCAQGRAAFEAGDVGTSGNRFTRAQDIVTELRVTLDMTQGEIAAEPGEPLRVRRRAAHRRPAPEGHGRDRRGRPRDVRPALRVGPDRRHRAARHGAPRPGRRREPCWLSSAACARSSSSRPRRSPRPTSSGSACSTASGCGCRRGSSRATTPALSPADAAEARVLVDLLERDQRELVERARRRPRRPPAPSSGRCAPDAPRWRATAPRPPAARSTSTAPADAPGRARPDRRAGVAHIPGRLPTRGAESLGSVAMIPRSRARRREESRMKVHEVDVTPGASRAHRLARRDRPQRLVRVEPGGGRPVRPPRPRRRGSASATTRSRCCANLPQETLDAAAADESFVAMVGPGRPPPRRLRQRAGLARSAPPTRRRTCSSPTSRSSSGSTPASRSTPAASASSPATTSSRRPTSASPSSAWACCTAAATSASSSAPTAASASATRPPTGRTCRSRTRPTPTGTPVVVEVQVGDDLVRAAVRRIQVGRVPLLLLDADLPGNSEDGPRDHQHALRRRPRAAHPPGDPARRRRRPRPRRRRDGADRVPHERGPLGAPRPRADAGAHRRTAGSAPPRRASRWSPRPSSPPTPRSPPATRRSTPTLARRYLEPHGRRPSA